MLLIGCNGTKINVGKRMNKKLKTRAGHGFDFFKSSLDSIQ